MRDALLERFQAVRGATEALAAPLSPEDQQLQSMPSASPTKWHRAHTTWFFETFVLAARGIAPADARWGYLFNSYYEAAGPRHARPRRGILSRPSCQEITAYRRAVDGRMLELLGVADDRALGELRPVVELGLAHEEQHQELLLTDILSAFADSPLRPAYRAALPAALTGARREPGVAADAVRWHEHPGGVTELGAPPGRDTFVFDNETPRHRVFLEPFAIASRLVTVGEWKAFRAAGGYATPSLWLSEGWDRVRAAGIDAPAYARLEGGALVVFGVDGEREACDDEPLAHVDYYEADAIARFLGARLPTEAEWEAHARRAAPERGNFREDGALRPLAAAAAATRDAPAQLFGDVWEWTGSSYEAYPGYAPAAGALGEYNGKFMVGQRVLRGGSCFSPRGHVRATYRNFWHPDTRFQVTGLRLARSVKP